MRKVLDQFGPLSKESLRVRGSYLLSISPITGYNIEGRCVCITDRTLLSPPGNKNHLIQARRFYRYFLKFTYSLLLSNTSTSLLAYSRPSLCSSSNNDYSISKRRGIIKYLGQNYGQNPSKKSIYKSLGRPHRLFLFFSLTSTCLVLIILPNLSYY